MKKLPNFKQVSKHSSNTVQEDIKNTPSTRKTYSKSNCGVVTNSKNTDYFYYLKFGIKVRFNDLLYEKKYTKRNHNPVSRIFRKHIKYISKINWN